MAQDGGKVVSITHGSPLPPVNTPGTHFFYRLSRPQGHRVAVVQTPNAIDHSRLVISQIYFKLTVT